MEYFLPLSVLAMIISTISFYLLENKNPKKGESEHNQDAANPPNLMEDSSKDYIIKKSSISPKNDPSIVESSTNEVITKISSTHAYLKEIHPNFSRL